MIPSQRISHFLGAMALALMFPAFAHAQSSVEPWSNPYSGQDAQGPHVLGYWRFEAGKGTEDSSSHRQTLKLNGAAINTNGRFGSCLESFPGGPSNDVRHAAIVPHHPRLSPTGAFSLEMWLQPKPEFEEHKSHIHLIDKKYVSHHDYQLILDQPAADGGRRFRAVLGFGENSQSWSTDQPVKLKPGTWTHLALTYDAAGSLQFYLNGVPAGGGLKPGRGAIIGGKLPLSIGDRSGSTYAGFPGFLDEVRLTSGVREFRAMSVVDQNRRRVFLRGEPAPRLSYRIFNHERTPLENVQATISAPSGEPIVSHIGQIAVGESYELSWPFDTRLRPDQYDIPVRVTATTGDRNLVGEQVVQVTLVPRQSPHRMPVIMWGIGGLETAIKSFDKLKEIGFTHCLGLTCDYGTIWKAKQPTAPATEEGMKSADVMLDAALANDLGIIVGLSPGNWLDSQKQYRRIGRDGKQTRRENLANVSPEIEKYFFNVGASVANAWGNHPAVHAAMVDTEIRDGTSPSFHPQEQQAYRDFAGVEIPEEVASSRGVSWTKLKNFPASRIVPDNDPILKYYNWFWKNGDGWNTWHTALHRGFHSADAQRKSGPPLWTYFDPAVRAPSLYGSGGEVDFLSHWTYTYPDPIRIGLCTDELLTMAGGSSRSTPQSVMKMTQLIWYRSQTAPTQTKVENLERSPWEDFDPDAAYITIAPMHLREALWMKLSRPIQGIMYHGWGSLVPGITSGYRYTHPETQHELSRLVKSVVEPLGPALRQIPAAPADVALLESFTSQMLAGRGTYGWGGSWGADCWHVLQYAHLQTDIVYDETILQNGLDQYRVLVLPDCDVLTESVAAAIHKFQQRGGIVIGDDRLAPGIKPDIRLTAWRRTRKAQEDQAKLIGMATELRKQLAGKYQPESDADQADVIVQRRRAGSSDYLFAINDRREYGQYVGQHGLVMEQGKPVTANVSIQRSAGHVYDLRRHRKVSATRQEKSLQWPVTLAPADGALYLITQRPVEQLQVTAPESISAGDTLELSIRVTDQANQPVDAVIPVQVQITDPDGRPAEFSGYHATVGGELKLPLDTASNDVRGIWTITVEEFATGQTIQQFVRVK